MNPEKHPWNNPERRKELEFRAKLDKIFRDFEELHPFAGDGEQSGEITDSEEIHDRLGRLEELKQMIEDSEAVREDEKEKAVEVAERWYQERKDQFLS